MDRSGYMTIQLSIVRRSENSDHLVPFCSFAYALYYEHTSVKQPIIKYSSYFSNNKNTCIKCGDVAPPLMLKTLSLIFKAYYMYSS